MSHHDGLVLDSEDPLDAAKAIGLCSNVLSAKWVLGDGSDIPTDPTKRAAFHVGHGILTHFGANNAPHEGERMLMLSSGTARNTDEPGSVYRSFDKKYASNSPYENTPALSCGEVPNGAGQDAAAVEFEIQLPSNAYGFSFDIHFFTYEWSHRACSNAVDFFAAKVIPFPADTYEGNIARNALGEAMASNILWFESCACAGEPQKCLVGGKEFLCPMGKNLLLGTPFESDLAHPGWSHASTGWLAARTGGLLRGSTVTLRLTTYDTSDGLLDSSTLIDNWRWVFNPEGSGPCGPECPPPK